MADKKISQLTAATVPLAGTEVLPIVQSSTTVKVSVADVTKGRTIQTTGINDNNNNEVVTITTTASAVNELTVANAATGANPVIAATGSDTNIGITLTPKGTGNAVLTSGNLIVANGNGIDFSATSGTGTSELLNDYEEGTWTPAIRPDGTGTAWTATVSGTYTKIGRLVFLTGSIEYTVKTGTGNYAFMTGLPFTPSANGNWNYCPLQQDTSNNYQLRIATNPRGEFYKNNAPGVAGPLTGAELGPATGTITFALSYEI